MIFTYILGYKHQLHKCVLALLSFHYLKVMSLREISSRTLQGISRDVMSNCHVQETEGMRPYKGILTSIRIQAVKQLNLGMV